MVNVKKTRGRKIVKKRMVVKKSIRAPKNLDRIIKKVINKNAETKYTPIDEFEYPITANNNFMNGATNLSNCFDINQGTGDGQRVGNTINCTKAVLNLIVRRNNIPVVNSKPCVLSIFIGYLKNNRGELPNAYYGQLFEDGNSSLPWNGTMVRTLRKVNKRMFSVLHRYDFKIGLSTTTNMSNNDFSTFIRKKIPLKELLGKVTYTDDDVFASAHNKDLYMFASYCNIDDSIDPISTDATTRQVDLLYFVDIEYKDY